ncbi:5093_t:CDS:1, partial [Racocetra persica]
SIVSPTPQPSGAKLVLNNNVYLFNTKNLTWVKTFDTSNINGTSSIKPDNNKGSSSDDQGDSLSLGAKIGIGVGAVVGFVLIVFAGFFIYNKLCKRDSDEFIATPGALYTEYSDRPYSEYAQRPVTEYAQRPI